MLSNRKMFGWYAPHRVSVSTYRSCTEPLCRPSILLCSLHAPRPQWLRAVFIEKCIVEVYDDGSPVSINDRGLILQVGPLPSGRIHPACVLSRLLIGFAAHVAS